MDLIVTIIITIITILIITFVVGVNVLIIVVHVFYVHLQSLYDPTIILNDIKMIQLPSEADVLDHLIEFIFDCEID